MMRKNLIMKIQNLVVNHKSQPVKLNPANCPPQLKELVPFEEDLIKLVKNLRFREEENKFQRTLAKDLKGI